LLGKHFLSGLKIHHSMASLILMFQIRNLLFWWISLCMTWHFCLADFNFLSVLCISHVLTMIYLEVIFWSGLLDDLKPSSPWMSSFSQDLEFSVIIPFNVFSVSLTCTCSPSHVLKICRLMISQRS
jgi:hypothetical protein